MDHGYWFVEEYCGFFAVLQLKPGIKEDQILNISNWPKEFKKIKVSEDYGPK